MTIEELKQAYEAATPGPWEVDASSDYGTAVCENGNSFIAAWTRSMHRQNYPHRANARLIVAAVNNLPKLLKVVEAVDIDCLARAGWWMSAALDGPLACAECKQDFGAALQQFEALEQALEELNND